MADGTRFRTLDIVAWGLWGGCVLAYHAYLFSSVRARSGRIQLSIMFMNNPAWTGKMIRMKGSEVTAVQTLRNTIIVATFVGGFAFTNATSYVEGLATTGISSELSNSQIRVLALAAVLYVAFINFAFVVRTVSHLGYLMGTATGRLDVTPDVSSSRRTLERAEVPAIDTKRWTTCCARPSCGSRASSSSAHTPSDVSLQNIEACVEVPLHALEAADVALVCEELIRSVTFHFSLGFRAFYVAIPLALYAGGAIPFIISTCLIIAWLVYLDHAAAAAAGSN